MTAHLRATGLGLLATACIGFLPLPGSAATTKLQEPQWAYAILPGTAPPRSRRTANSSNRA